MNTRRILFTLLVLVSQQASAQTAFQKIKSNFLNPAEDTRPGCYWYWINDNISKEGITKDLEAMARVGIGRAYIGHIFDRRNETDTKPGAVKFMSSEWWGILQWAVKEADRCNIDIGFFNSPGWSQSGGPWIKTSESMRYLGNSEFLVDGGKKIDTIIPVPNITTYPNTRAARVRTGPDFSAKDFQDVKVLAIRQTKSENGVPAVQTFEGDVPEIQNLFDGSDATFSNFETNKEKVIITRLKKDVFNSTPVRNIIIKPLDHSYLLLCKIESSHDGKNYREVTTYSEERGHQGPKKTDNIVVPFKETEDAYFRITLQFKTVSSIKDIRIAEISFSNKALLGGYVRKQLGETSPKTKVAWTDYIWTPQNDIKENVIQSDQVIDLTNKMDKDGRLVWDAPFGNWKILRFGMIPIGTQCHPCGPESLGFEVDKMSREHINSLFEGMVGEFLKRTPKEDRRALKYVIGDSYETGPQNWTDDFISKFINRFHYSPVKFLPVLAGNVVDNVQVSDRFLWDMRRLVVESVANDYVGGLKEICNKNGLTLWLENYGHWGFISEFLLYGSKTDEVGGEFWESWDSFNNIECRAAASSAHTYGKKSVYAEAFTSTRTFLPTPASLKRWCDWSYGAGINHQILHVYIHQPEEKKPGIIQWFGTAFNRHNTWFEQSKEFIDYMRRSAVLLKSGNPVADIAYYIGENSPSMEGPMIPALPDGYDFDHINSDVLIHYASVKNGKIMIRNGPSYSVLVLPPSIEMRPEVAEAIQRLVKAGAIVVGKKPKTSPSLEGYPNCDTRLRKIANDVWADVNGTSKKSRQYGSGWIYDGLSLEAVLNKHRVQKDVEVITKDLRYGVAGDGKIGVNNTGAIIFKHRTADDHEVYFISNTSENRSDFSVSFRQAKGTPLKFNAVTGSVTDVLDFHHINNRTVVSLHLEASESIFIVFVGDKTGNVSRSDSVNINNIADLSKNWKARFYGQGAPDEVVFENLTDWTENKNEWVRYYSGKADYEKTFHLPEIPAGKLFLDLGKVSSIATVSINNKIIGTLWTAPWAIDITPFVKKGDNTLKITVTNTWNNRLVGDKVQNLSEPFAYVSQPYVYDKKSPLDASGLIGPVWIKQEIINKKK